MTSLNEYLRHLNVSESKRKLKNRDKEGQTFWNPVDEVSRLRITNKCFALIVCDGDAYPHR